MRNSLVNTFSKRDINCDFAHITPSLLLYTGILLAEFDKDAVLQQIISICWKNIDSSIALQLKEQSLYSKISVYQYAYLAKKKDSDFMNFLIDISKTVHHNKCNKFSIFGVLVLFWFLTESTLFWAFSLTIWWGYGNKLAITSF